VELLLATGGDATGDADRTGSYEWSSLPRTTVLNTIASAPIC